MANHQDNYTSNFEGQDPAGDAGLSLFLNGTEYAYRPSGSDTTVYIPTVEKYAHDYANIVYAITRILAAGGSPIVTKLGAEFTYTSGDADTYSFVNVSGDNITEMTIDRNTGTVTTQNNFLRQSVEVEYGVDTASDVASIISKNGLPYVRTGDIVANLYKIEVNKYTFRTTHLRVDDDVNYLDIVDYVVNGSAWTTVTKTVSSDSSGSTYLKKVSSPASFDTTGLSGTQTVVGVNDVPADGIYQVSVMLSVTPKTASATKSDLVFGFYGTDGIGMADHTFHAVVDDSQTFAQQLSFSTTLNLKAGTNSLKLLCDGLNTDYLVFVDSLTVAQLVNGVYHNGDDFDEVHTLTEAADFNNDDGVLVDGATGGPRFMLWQTLANKILGFIKSLSTTITAFRTGDVIPVDGPQGTAKISKDNLLRETAENAAASGLVATPDQVDNKIEEALVYEYVDDTQQTETNALDDEGSVSGYKITYNTQYTLANLKSNTYLQVHCFAVEKGKTYRVKSGRGVDDQYSPYGVITTSRLANISGVKTYKQIIYGGNDTGSIATKTFTFTAEFDGFVYLNSSQTSTTFALWECTAVSVKEKIAEIDVNASAVPTLQQALNDEITRSEGQDYFADKFVKGDALTDENVTADGSGSLANYKVYYDSLYNLVALRAQNNLSVHCYKVTAGKHYRIENCYGNNDSYTPYAVIANGQLATTSSTKTFKQFITDGITHVNPQKLEVIEFEALFDGYLYVNTRTSYDNFGVFSMNNLAVKEVVEGLMGGGSLNHWKGKKIVWMGTSVPYGSGATTSYVKIIQDALQFNLIPAVIPGEALHAQYDSDSGLWYPLTYGSTCLSKSEYAAAKAAGLTSITIQDAPITPWVPGGDWQHYNNYYRTYDNVLTAENADADLWVLDVVPNNVNFALDDFNAFDFTNWKYSDDSSFASHRGTFLGALLFLINEIYTLNANARILLFLGSAFAYSEGKSNFEKLTAKGVELVDIWGDVNLLKPSLAVIKQQGGSDNHPSTFGHEVLGKRLIGRMLSVS